MVDYGFLTLGLNRIQLQVWVDNIAGVKAYERAGFKREGMLRQAMFHDGKYCDFLVMSILREEYLAEMQDIRFKKLDKTSGFWHKRLQRYKKGYRD